jgi:hypothetical protein
MVDVGIRGTRVWGECEPVREEEGTIDPKECDRKCVSQDEVANGCQRLPTQSKAHPESNKSTPLEVGHPLK